MNHLSWRDSRAHVPDIPPLILFWQLNKPHRFTGIGTREIERLDGDPI